jgi:hypothetical protein
MAAHSKSVSSCRITSSELREAMTDGPILLRGLENEHEHVLRANAGAFAEQLRHAPEQRLFLFHGAGFEHGDLDVHDISAPSDAVVTTVAEVRGLMLRDGHELIVFDHVQRYRQAIFDSLYRAMREAAQPW